VHGVAFCTGNAFHHALNAHLATSVAAGVRKKFDNRVVADFKTRALLASLRVIAIAVEAHRTFAPFLAPISFSISGTGANWP
jgi:hypothetical protein